MDRDDVTSAGLTAIGVVASTVARAVALGGRLVAAGLGTLENALRGDDGPAGGSEERPVPPRPASGPVARSSFARVSEPALEPADGVTAPARRPGTVTRRSSAGAAARTTPDPRPAKRATAKSLPPNLRPVEPVKGAAGASDGVSTPTAKKAAAKKATAKKATAATTTAKKAAAKETTAEKTAAGKTAAGKTAAGRTTAEKTAPVKGAAGAAPAPVRPPRKAAKGTAAAPDVTTNGSSAD